MPAARGLFRFYNCIAIANLVSQWLKLHCSGLSFRCLIRRHPQAGLVFVLLQYNISPLGWVLEHYVAITEMDYSAISTGKDMATILAIISGTFHG